ncbi:MAG: hypothetical protein JWN72_2347 [Thermoleophilia bacterium]|nr:hypothetical protein [Thermoleophilia bacterium]
MKKLLLVIVALLIIVLVAFAVRTVGARDETDAVSTKDAGKLVGADKTGDGDAVDAGLRPEAGTYSYTGSGTESISALGGSTHEFPDKIAAVVKLDQDDDCGWSLNVVYVEQHIEERNYCTTDTGVVDNGFERRIEFFNQTEVKTYTCGDDAKRLVADAAVGSTTTWVCKQADKATSTYTATNLGPAQVSVGGAQTDTTHVKVVSKQTGDTRGGDVQEIWYLPSGLPAKFNGKLKVTTASVLGDTDFNEQYEYTIASSAPVEDDA